MKPLPYLFSKKAVVDLEDVWHYTVEKWSVTQANRYYQLIMDEINFICNNSNAGKPMEHIRKNYRSSKVKSHLIFFRVTNNSIEIIRILHEQMDIENRLSD